MTNDELAELEALRHAPFVDPADIDRGEVLVATGVGIGVIGVGVLVVSAICPPCLLGMVPLSAVTGTGLIAAGLVKRWRRRRRDAAAGGA